MKVLLFAAAMVLSLPAFAASTVTYRGEGGYTMPDGKKGVYEVESIFDVADDKKVKITSIYKSAPTSFLEVKTVTVIISPTTDGYFDVMNVANEKIGDGYYFKVQSAKKRKIAHYTVKFGDYTIEETAAFMGSALYRVGSAKNADGATAMSWIENLKKED